MPVPTWLDAFFLARMEIDGSYASFNHAKEQIEHQEGPEPIENISRAAGISSRNLGRLFGRYLGFSPKYFARIVRFQKALRILVKDFRRFTGGVPRGYKGYYPPAAPADFAPNVVRFLQDGKRG